MLDATSISEYTESYNFIFRRNEVRQPADKLPKRPHEEKDISGDSRKDSAKKCSEIFRNAAVLPQFIFLK